MSAIYSVRTLHARQSKLGLGLESSASKIAQQIVPAASLQNLDREKPKLYQVLWNTFLNIVEHTTIF